MQNDNVDNLGGIRLYTSATASGADMRLVPKNTANLLRVTNNKAEYYADLAKKYKEETKGFRDEAKYFAEQNSDVTVEYIEDVKNELVSMINEKHPAKSDELGLVMPDNLTTEVDEGGVLSVNTDFVNQSKALETGNVSTNPDVYADIKKYAHSAFDSSKFVITGETTLNNDGIARLIFTNPANMDTINSNNLEALYVVPNWENPEDIVIETPLYTLDKEAVADQKYLFRSYQRVYDEYYGIYQDNGISAEMNRNGTCSFNMTVPNPAPDYGVTKLRCEGHLPENISVYSPLQFKCVWTHNKMEMYFRENGTGSWNLLNSIEKNLLFNTQQSGVKLSIGAFGHDWWVFQGEIDLKYLKIEVNGIETFNGNKTGADKITPDLEIPYTLSKTGSKIVEAKYRDRVQDMYEQFGYAPYYTIDEENKNFTLPMGEIYGMIEKKSRNLDDLLRPIGRPIMVMNNEPLSDDEIYLEGGKVLKTTYPKLAEVYGDTYAPPEAEDTDIYLYLIDWRDRIMLGASDFGYSEQVNPTVTLPYGGYTTNNVRPQTRGTIVCGSGTGEAGENLESLSNMSADRELTVSGKLMPQAVKVRFKTRFK